MALTFTDVTRINIKHSDGVRFALVDITLDASYPAGGWPITPANFKMTGILGVIPIGKGVSGGRVFEWDTTNSKLWARETGAAVNAVLAEIGAAEASGQVIRCLVIGY